MKINNVSQSINFMAGKVQVYSDFDGTYCPARHSDIRDGKAGSAFKNYCEKMTKFFNDTKGDVHFHVTTGRTFGEYKAVSELLKTRNFELPLPETFIAKNGSDEYIKTGTDKEFYGKGEFPFDYTKPNQQKEKNLKSITNWNGGQIKNYIRGLADKYKMKLIEADSENSVRDYGANSLFSEGKLNPDEWRNIRNKDGIIDNHDTPIVDYVIGARKDGNLKINLIFPPDYGYCPERNASYDAFMSDIKSYLASNNVKYNIEWEEAKKKNFFRKHCNISPSIEGKPLTKLYDTREALKSAIQNNDMVIAAGDGSNDFDMLNPLEYIEQKDWDKFKEKSENKEFYNSNMSQKLSALKEVYSGKNESLKSQLEKDGLLSKIEKMPIYSIIINREDSKLSILKDVFGSTGKVIEVDKGHLEDGIKLAVKHHAGKSKSFLQEMSDKLRLITDSKKEGRKKFTVAALISCAVLALCGIIYAKLDSKNEVPATQANLMA